jgi:hypothetical protein
MDDMNQAETQVPAVEPVRRPGGARSRRARWSIALAIVALVGLLSIGGLAVMTVGGASSALAPWAPATTTVYVELRTDLPGDQQTAVGTLLSRFPGFDDQAALDMKVDTAIGDLVRQATGQTVDYGRDLKPWLGGEIAGAAGALDTVAKTADGRMTGGWALLLATTKDPAATTAFLDARLGASTATETVGTTTVHTVAVNEVKDRTIAWAIVGTTVLVGDRAAVESAIDAQSTGGLAGTKAFRQAIGYVPAEHVAMAWTDAPALVDAAGKARSTFASGASPLPSMPETGRTPPAWVVGSVRAEAGGAVVEIVAPRPDDVAVGKPRTSTLASRLPGDTMAVVEVHDAGTLVQKALDMMAKDPGMASQLGPAAPLANGALGSFVDWGGDGAIAVTRSGGTVHGGLVVSTLEQSVAETRVAAIRALLAFADGPNGRPVVTEQPYGAGTIVTVSFGDVRDALVKAITDAAGSGANAPSADQLAQLREMLPADASVSYTVQGGLFVLGTDAAFVKDVVDTTSATSLEASPAYRAAIDLAGASNDGQAFVDAAAAVDLARSADATISSTLGGDVASFVDRITSLGAAYTATDDVVRLRLALAVRAR